MTAVAVGVPLDLTAIAQHVSTKHVKATRHPTLPLTIYNYTPKVIHERYWTPETMACRGLIVHDDGRIIARPFAKFFNLTEYGGEIPRTAYTVYDKLDGSLGIIYDAGPAGGGLAVATRGSFTSEQAVVGTRLLREQHGDVTADMLKLPQRTYCLEIIYPANVIVVDYRGQERLYLLAVLDTETGHDVDEGERLTLGMLLGNSAARHPSHEDPYALATTHVRLNAEGYVLHWPGCDLRLKVKFPEYLALHRLLTGLTKHGIWAALRTSDLNAVMALHVPDEFRQWVDEQADALNAEFNAVLARGQADLDAARSALGSADRRAYAAWFTAHAAQSAVCFRLLDGKPADSLIWKLIEPTAGSRAFRCDSPEA